MRLPFNDNQVIVAVDLMNLEATINWFLLEKKARDMGARRRLALGGGRMAAAGLELAE